MPNSVYFSHSLQSYESTTFLNQYHQIFKGNLSLQIIRHFGSFSQNQWVSSRSVRKITLNFSWKRKWHLMGVRTDSDGGTLRTYTSFCPYSLHFLISVALERKKKSEKIIFVAKGKGIEKLKGKGEKYSIINSYFPFFTQIYFHKCVLSLLWRQHKGKKVLFTFNVWLNSDLVFVIFQFLLSDFFFVATFFHLRPLNFQIQQKANE